jgi:hypothetical protein
MEPPGLPFFHRFPSDFGFAFAATNLLGRGDFDPYAFIAEAILGETDSGDFSRVGSSAGGGLSTFVFVETPAYSHAQMRTHTHDVQSPLSLTPTTKTVVRVPPSVTQKVTWKDALFPRVLPARVQCTPQ